MTYIILKVIDQDNNPVELEDLTDTGLQEVKGQCESMIEKVNEQLDKLEGIEDEI